MNCMHGRSMGAYCPHCHRVAPGPAGTIQISAGWTFKPAEPSTRCKHGMGSCERCGTSDRRDVIHTARTPDKRTQRRRRKRAKR